MAEGLAPRARRTAVALAETLMPAAGSLRAADERTVAAAEEILRAFGDPAVRGYGALLRTFENVVRPTHGGRGFSRLDPARRNALLTRWVDGSIAQRSLALALTAPLKVGYFDDAGIYDAKGARHRFVSVEERPRWMDQVTPGAALDEDDIECDVVVVGTGAGGAVAAKELAQRGLAVMMLEEGEYHTRSEFNGSAIDGFRRFYRAKGMIAALGTAVIPIPLGRLVGGCTAINTGTCWRTPDWVLDRWSREAGLTEFAPGRLDPYFERVERELHVEAATQPWLGGVANVIARGADALRFSHRPLNRNAPGCDGSGVCDFGCPTDARRSTNVSYVPRALEGGAMLATGVRAERVIREDGRAAGIEARVLATGRRVRVRARATVLACGSLLTPLILQRDGIHKTLRHVGRNLSIHPATTVSALFDEEIRGYAAIPQGYCVDEFHRDGILMMGASAPIDIGAAQFAFSGRRLMELMDRYENVASFGVMVEDEPRGRVRPGIRGRPLITYRLGRLELDRLHRGVEMLVRIFLAAGAREVYPAAHGHRAIRTPADLERFRSHRPAARDWLCTAFHPLGTCRIATGPAEGVVDTAHQVFGVPDLYVMDGSAVPGPPAVNPQVTIMTLVTRAADLLADRLEASRGAA
jgi:choline dehydrogenase-like flavoprotein